VARALRVETAMRNLQLLAALLAVGCSTTSMPDATPQARLVVNWDPLVCGAPHRVVLELEDDAGVSTSESVPCEIGSITLDVTHWGVYRARIYAWTPDTTPYSIVFMRLDIDQQIIYLTVETPR
jgi:hypothetical protein